MNIVVKLSSNLINPDNSIDVIDRIAADIVKLKANGNNVIIVTSGAVMYGMKTLGYKSRPDSMPLLQSCASIGQIHLLGRYQSTFQKYGLIPAEILLSADDFKVRSRYLNLRNTMKNLVNLGVIPVINENDSVNTSELKFGDNDNLSSLITLMIDFDMLLLLTDVDGVYDKDPKHNKDANLLKQIKISDISIMDGISDSGSTFTVGGMKKKLEASFRAVQAGITVFIGNGFKVRLTNVVEDNENGSYLVPDGRKVSARKKWIAFAPSGKSSIIVDEGACTALLKKESSLLASGIMSVEGNFMRGTLVSIYCDGEKIAQGLSNYSSDELDLIKGKKSKDIKAILSSVFYEEVIHKNNLIILK